MNQQDGGSGRANSLTKYLSGMDQAGGQCPDRDLRLPDQPMACIEQEHMKRLAACPANSRLEMSVHIHGISDRLSKLERLRFDPTSKLERRQETRGLGWPETTHPDKGGHRGAGELNQSARLLDDGPGQRVGSPRARSRPENQRDKLRVRERSRSKARQAFAGSILRCNRARN